RRHARRAPGRRPRAVQCSRPSLRPSPGPARGPAGPPADPAEGRRWAAGLPRNLAAGSPCPGPAGHAPAAPPGPGQASPAADVAPPGFPPPGRAAHDHRPADEPVRLHAPLSAAAPSRRPVPAAASDPSSAQLAAKTGAPGGDGVGAIGLGRPAGTRPSRPGFRYGHARLHRRRPHPSLAAREECSLAEFDAALQTLNQSVPAIKRRIVVACAACILANQQVTVREAELLRAICDTLDCPLPPLVVGEAEGR